MVSQLIETPKAGEIREYKMLVGGEWVDARSGKTFESVNPYTGKVWATVPEAGDEDVDRAVRAAREAFDEGPWGKMTGTERARLLRRFADVLAENAEDKRRAWNRAPWHLRAGCRKPQRQASSLGRHQDPSKNSAVSRADALDIDSLKIRGEF